ncbi:hypothetical protein FRC03_000910 [Tulasnella sp. 419]|nr:hypothetical protein FRC03_000910 [Tulasnella sp. 419]
MIPTSVSNPNGPRPIVAVCGALGKQGGAVIRALADDNVFSLRAITRKSKNAPAAEDLLALPNTVICQADYDDSKSLLEAFQGCYGVFAVTNYFEAGSNEEEQGRRIVDAAKACGVKHFVWSSSPDADGKVPIYHSKATVADYLKSSGVPYTTISVPTYYDSLFHLFQKTVDANRYRFTSPYPTNSPMPAVDISDFGAYVAAIFLDPEEWTGKDLNPANERITPQKLVQDFQEAFSPEEGDAVTVDVLYNLTIEEFRALPSDTPELLGLKSNLDFFLENQDAWSTDLAKRLHPEIKTWKDYCIQRHDSMTNILDSMQALYFEGDQIIESVAAEDAHAPAEEVTTPDSVFPGGRGRSQSTIKVDIEIIEVSHEADIETTNERDEMEM